jgi:hypothetical protein
MTTRDEQVLELAHETFQMSRKITTPVDIHKRYQTNDNDDPYARLIEFVHEAGTTLFGAKQ